MLDLVPGIGEVRKKELLKKFGSLKKMKEASSDEFLEILTKDISEKLVSYLKELQYNKENEDGAKMEKDKIIESLESRLADLDEERQKIMDRLIQLEEEELKEKFHVNDCFIDVISSGIYNYAYKVIRVNADSILVVKVLRDHIEQKITTSSATTNWEKITSEQFDTLLKLGLDVINNPDDDRSFDREICAIKSNLKN